MGQESAVTWMDLGVVRPNEQVREGRTNTTCYHRYMEFEKMTEMSLFKNKNRHRQGKEGRDKSGGWD